MAEPRKGFRRCSRCERNRAERFFAPRGRVCSTCRKQAGRKAAHESRVQRTYGLQAGEYDVLFAAQDGRCAICLERRSQNLSVDHDHNSGAVRGLLCRRCNNQLLGKGARDRAHVLRRAADYLDAPPAQALLGLRIHIDNQQA
ncbi:endonuclease domain-containing protein [Streptomyces sp. CBMA123]|uniref:endonuclease domain-containing protein n=1 Tax=Streptomyces sp. CBMA123 TaxID=1896313 RepID=UPI0016621693|nr:endonuclease domain-containing protein [Streptomyces sp. CBMA123]MBD0689667.1 hypothetical protein [Streptomyces sp. CBMA123]